VGLLHTLATLPTHPESVPINALVAVKGTPLEDQKVFRTADYLPLSIVEMIAASVRACIAHMKNIIQVFDCTMLNTLCRL